jgi:hypothetical protein
MRTNYVLIDFENVQPKNLELLKGHGFKVILLVGSRQVKISFDVAAAMQSLGADGEYVKIGGNGQNALDFHIAFLMGQISAGDPECYFHVISKDAGFDPLIAYMKERKIHAQRETDVSDIPLLRISNSKTIPERIEAVIKYLKTCGTAKPRAVKTLSNSINVLFQRKLEEEEVAKIIDALVRQQIVVVNGTKVSYQLPDEP